MKISSFTPSGGMAGATVKITGCGFSGATSVNFNGVSATFSVNSSTQITATVPQKASSGVIAVNTSNGQVVRSVHPFVVPALTLTPTAGAPTSTVSVSGSAFGHSEAVDIYFDTTDEALAATDAQGAFTGISFLVPASAGPGTHWVTAVGRHSGLSAQAAFAVQTNWAQFHNGPDHTGVNRVENVLSPTNVANLDGTWTAAIGRPGLGVVSSPAVANGVLYVNSLTGQLYAFNAQTGAQLWSATSDADYSSPAVANGVVYTGSFSNDLLAFNAQTGAPLWAAPTGSRIVSSPVVVNGVVYVGSFDHSLYAFNAQTGAQLWAAATGASIASSPAVVNGIVYVGSQDHSLYAFNAQTGAQLWVVATGGPVDSAPAVVNGVVYTSSEDGHLYAFNAQTGAQVWATTIGPVGIVFFIESSPAVVNGVVYAGSRDGHLYALNAQTGAQLWAAPTGGIILSSPAVANGVVYVGSADNYLYAFNAQTGAQLWTALSGGFIYSSPAVANGMVYIGSQDGNLYAYGLPTSAQMKASARPNPASLHPDPSLHPTA